MAFRSSAPTRRSAVLAGSAVLAAAATMAGGSARAGGALLSPDQVDAMVKTLADAQSHGFRKTEFTPPELAEAIRSGALQTPAAQARLKTAILAYARAQRGLRLRPADFLPEWSVRPAPYDPAPEFARAVAANHLQPWLDTLPPRYQGYAALRKSLATYRAISAAGGWASVPEADTPLTVGMSDPRVVALRVRLALEDSAVQAAPDQPDVFDPALAAAVQQQRDQHGDDRDHDQQFDQGEAGPIPRPVGRVDLDLGLGEGPECASGPGHAGVLGTIRAWSWMGGGSPSALPFLGSATRIMTLSAPEWDPPAPRARGRKRVSPSIPAGPCPPIPLSMGGGARSGRFPGTRVRPGDRIPDVPLGPIVKSRAASGRAPGQRPRWRRLPRAPPGDDARPAGPLLPRSNPRRHPRRLTGSHRSPPPRPRRPGLPAAAEEDR